MTFQKYCLDALTTELWGNHGEQDHKLGSYVWHVLPEMQGSICQNILK